MPPEAADRHLSKAEAQSNKLVFLEIGRALAALIVVFHHADQATAHFSDIARTRFFMWGQYGVDFFFVLSGFIIFHAHRGDTGGLLQARLYVFKRVARIYIPYLPIAFAYMGLLLIFQQGPLAERTWGFWSTLTLFPTEKTSTLSVAWTLTYEMIFYSFFLIGFLSKRLLYAVSVLWCGYLLAVLSGTFQVSPHPVAAALSNPIILEFFCGALAAMVLPKLPVRMRGVIFALGVLGLAVVVVNWTGQRVFLGPPMALIVLAAATIPYRKANVFTDGLIFLGAASYAIYLVHSPVVSVVAEVLQPLDQRVGVFLACVALGTIGGVFYHVIFEKPALAWAQRFRPRRDRSALVEATSGQSSF